MDRRNIQIRDAATRRLRRVTTATAAGAGVLALVFAGLAAKAFPGRSAHAATTTTTTTPAATTQPTQSAPPIVSAGSSAPSPAPSSSAPSSPAQTSAPPAVVSGGS